METKKIITKKAPFGLKINKLWPQTSPRHVSMLIYIIKYPNSYCGYTSKVSWLQDSVRNQSRIYFLPGDSILGDKGMFKEA